MKVYSSIEVVILCCKIENIRMVYVWALMDFEETIADSPGQGPGNLYKQHLSQISYR